MNRLRAGHSESGSGGVEAPPHPVPARITGVSPSPQRVAASAAEIKKAGRSSGGGMRVSATTTLKNAEGEDRHDDSLGDGGGDGGGGGYYAKKFSKFYAAFVATTSGAQVISRTSQHHPLASKIDVPDIEGDVDGIPSTPVTDDEGDESADVFPRSLSAPIGTMGAQREAEEGGREAMLRRSPSAGQILFGASQSRGSTFKRSNSFGATALAPNQGRSVGRANTLSPTPTRGSAVSPGGRSTGGRNRVAARFSASRAVTAETKTSELFDEPLASEGAGSVFPVDLPMDERVALEVEFIQRHDKLAINPNVGEFWMLIDANWISRWAAFVLGQAGPPGPISNRKLFGRAVFAPSSPVTDGYRSDASADSFASADSGGGLQPASRHLNIKPGLQPIRDYRAIHPLVWFIFREMYHTDGAPDICRTKLDIYSAEVPVRRRARILEPTHTKAVYQLRRFVARIKRDILADKEREAKAGEDSLKEKGELPRPDENLELTQMGSWEVPKNHGDIKILSYPRRKSSPDKAIAAEITAGDEKVVTEDIFRVPQVLSSQASNSSIGSDTSGSTTGSRITVDSRQRRPTSSHRSVGKSPATSVVEPSYLFPAGFPMDTRRELEVAVLTRFEKLSINPNIGEFWMMMDACWVGRWVSFAMASAGPPGPITNRNLYSQVVPAYVDDDGVGSSSGASFMNAGADSVGLTDSGLMQGLRITKDYRAVHPIAWYILETIYGTDGAPDICRQVHIIVWLMMSAIYPSSTAWKPDMYSHPVSVTRRLKVEKENQTKAFHLVSRAVQKANNKLVAARATSTGSDGGD
eukprot:g1614.t1